MKKILAFLIIAALLSACAATRATEAPTTAPQLEISNPSKILEAAAGSEFKIIIESNPTTGYHWEIVGELDGSAVQFVSKEYRADEPVLTGSGGVDVWTFKALGSGEAHITLGYYPPSNDLVEPQQIVPFTVTVK